MSLFLSRAHREAETTRRSDCRKLEVAGIAVVRVAGVAAERVAAEVFVAVGSEVQIC